MSFRNFIEKWFPVKGKIGPDTVIIDVPAELYYKELALHTAISMISNAVAKSEMKTFVQGEEVKEKDYFSLNISPNPNQNSGEFWRDVIKRTIRDEDGAYVVEYKGNLYCVDNCPIETQDTIDGNTYSGVNINEYTFPKRFHANDIYHFKMQNGIGSLINKIGEEYGKLLKSSADALKKSNGRKYRLRMENIEAGDEEFQKEFKDYIQKQLETYLSSENAVYPEFAGYELVKDEQGTKTADDFIKIRKDMFEMVANALHIPLTLMTGNITNMNEIVKVFLTFCIDPIADMIQEVLNKRAGFDNWKGGNFYKVDTGKINHRDIFDMAQAADKLLASGNLCIDEIREKIGCEPLNTAWSSQHWMTKNYVKIEDMMVILEEGE